MLAGGEGGSLTVKIMWLHFNQPKLKFFNVTHLIIRNQLRIVCQCPPAGWKNFLPFHLSSAQISMFWALIWIRPEIGLNYPNSGSILFYQFNPNSGPISNNRQKNSTKIQISGLDLLIHGKEKYTCNWKNEPVCPFYQAIFPENCHWITQQNQTETDTKASTHHCAIVLKQFEGCQKIHPEERKNDVNL